MSLVAPAGLGNLLMVLRGGMFLFAGALVVEGASHLMLAEFFVLAPAEGLAQASFDCVGG